MTPIVSPWFFYLMGVTEKAIPTFGIIGAVIFICVMIVGCFIADPWLWSNDEQTGKIKKALKKLLILSISFIIIALILPSKDTLISMAVAKNVTPNNITLAKDSARDAIDYIFEKLNESKETQ